MQLGLVMLSWLYFQKDMSNYPPVTIAEDERLCSTGQLDLSYNGDVLVYRPRLSMAHSMEQCEVSVTIPLSPEEP
jgi:hypothetical protein